MFFILWILSLRQAWAKAPVPWQVGLQEAATSRMESITWMHTLLLWIIGAIALLVACLLLFVILRYREKKNPIPSQMAHHTLLEVVWTLLPVLILGIIMIPSLSIMFKVNRREGPELTIQVDAHQWYWTYTYPSDNVCFDSYMLKEEELKQGNLRQLDVDHPLVIPAGRVVQLLLTSADVLHSFAVPSFGLKIDTVPGRIYETWIRVDKPGTYYGQCSELCGLEHGYMPIVVKVLPLEMYERWYQQEVKAKKAEEQNKSVSSDPSGKVAQKERKQNV